MNRSENGATIKGFATLLESVPVSGAPPHAVEAKVILLLLLYGSHYLYVDSNVTMVTICIACLFMSPDCLATMSATMLQVIS